MLNFFFNFIGPVVYLEVIFLFYTHSPKKSFFFLYLSFALSYHVCIIWNNLYIIATICISSYNVHLCNVYCACSVTQMPELLNVQRFYSTIEMLSYLFEAYFLTCWDLILYEWERLFCVNLFFVNYEYWKFTAWSFFLFSDCN